MKNKIMISQIISFFGSCAGSIIITLLKTFTQLPFAICIVIGAPIIICSLVIGYFLGRCPECHLLLSLRKREFKHCPRCGKKL